MVLLALRIVCLEDWEGGISGQQLGFYSPLSTTNDSQCKKQSMGKRTSARSGRLFGESDIDGSLFTPSSDVISSSNSGFDDDDHNSDEDYNYLQAHTRKVKKKKTRRRVGNVRYKEPATGLICHWCRQRTERPHVRCSVCVIKFCPACLKNRNGEKIHEEMRCGVQWICPRCRGGCGPGCKNCCNCGPCRKTQGKLPTGQLARTAREAGFSNVHDYLINLKTGESAEVIAKRKEGRGWTCVTGALGAVVEVSPIPAWGMKGLRTPKIPLGFLISKCREGRKDAMACEMANTDDSRTIQERAGNRCRSLAEFGREETQGGEDMSTSPDAKECQRSSTFREVSESPPRVSMEAGGGTECCRTYGAIPKRKRSVRTGTARKGDGDLVEQEKTADVNISVRGESQGKEQVGLPDINSPSEEDLFELPNLNSPNLTSDGVTNSYSSGQEITVVIMCSESEHHVPLSAEPAESSFSMTSQVPLADETKAATSTPATLADETAAATMVGDDEFSFKLDLALQRPFSSEQLKGMWGHFIFHRPAQQEDYTYHSSSDGEADELLCDYFSDLYEKLARTFSSLEKLKLLRGFFFWLQHSSMEGSFQPWVTEGSEDDQFRGCNPISISESQEIHEDKPAADGLSIVL